MTYPEAIQFLHGLRHFGANFGLDTTRQLVALAGNPHERLRFIHVAGTNGKGSTCAMLESIYRMSGLRVGLFTSPHLVSFAERIQVNRQMISEADVARLVAEMRPQLTGFPADRSPTFFEVVTVMALRYFAEQHCDLVIWETGLGGRLDATNIVTPLASVVTNIQFDHERWLGNTLAQIAAEKAGIIKPGVPVITGATEPDALGVITETARRCGSSLIVVTPADTQRGLLADTPVPLSGVHQRLNAAVALATVRALQSVLPVPDELIRAGLERTEWLGRLQRVVLPGGRCIVLDGAHNPAGVAALRAALEVQFPGARPAFIVGILEDKGWAAMCEQLVPLAGRMVAVPVSSERQLAPEKIVAACHALNPKLPVQACASLAEALKAVGNERLVVVAGSLYLIGEALEQLHLAPSLPGNEKALNEWTGGKQA